MLCAANNAQDPLSPKSMGLSVSLENGLEYPVEMQSPRRASLINNLFTRRNSSPSIKVAPSTKKDSTPKSPSWTIFSKKSQLAKSEPIVEKPEEDVATALLIEQLRQEGRSEEDIKLHLSFIQDVHTPTTPTPASLAPSSPKKNNIFTRFIRDVKQAFDEEFKYPPQYYTYEYEADFHPGLTVGISTAPFYGAPPPDMDMSYEELSALEPIYIGSKCINNLPTCTHDGTPLPGEQTRCPVCLGEFEKDECLKSLPCVHFYHKECIDSWLMVGHTCPVCKLVIE